MGVPASTFLDTYTDNVKKMRLILLNYMKALRTNHSQPGVPIGIGIGKAQHKLKLVLETTTEGYLILPIPLQSQNWNKHDWEDLFMMYIGQHYSKTVDPS